MKRPDWRQIAVKALHLDSRELARTALCEGGSAGIARQDVRIPMHTERLILLRVDGIVPGSGWKLNHTRPDAIGQPDGGEAGAPFVEQPDDVILGNPPGGSIIRMHTRHFPPPLLGPGTVAAEVELAVQSRTRLIGH